MYQNDTLATATLVSSEAVSQWLCQKNYCKKYNSFQGALLAFMFLVLKYQQNQTNQYQKGQWISHDALLSSLVLASSVFASKSSNLGSRVLYLCSTRLYFWLQLRLQM